MQRSQSSKPKHFWSHFIHTPLTALGGLKVFSREGGQVCGQTGSIGASLSKGAVVEVLELELGPLGRASPFSEERMGPRVWRWVSSAHTLSLQPSCRTKCLFRGRELTEDPHSSQVQRVEKVRCMPPRENLVRVQDGDAVVFEWLGICDWAGDRQAVC